MTRVRRATRNSPNSPIDSLSDHPDRTKDNSAAEDTSTPSHIPVPQVCIFHTYFGICKNRDECDFSHEPGDIASTPPSPTGSVPQTPRDNPYQRTQTGKHFQSGKSNKGPRSPFLHEKDNSKGGGRGKFKGRAKPPTTIHDGEWRRNKKSTTITDIEETKVSQTDTAAAIVTFDDPSPSPLRDDGGIYPSLSPSGEFADPVDEVYEGGGFPNDSPPEDQAGIYDDDRDQDADVDEPLQLDPEPEPEAQAPVQWDNDYAPPDNSANYRQGWDDTGAGREGVIEDEEAGEEIGEEAPGDGGRGEDPEEEEVAPEEEKGEDPVAEEAEVEVETGEDPVVKEAEAEAEDAAVDNAWPPPPNINEPSTPAPHTSTHSNSLAEQPPAPSGAPQVSLMTLHWCQFADPNADHQLAFCKAFAQNKCSNVDACKFRHCITVQEYGQLFKDQQPLQFTLDKRSIRNDSPNNLTVITSPSLTLHWSHYADPTCDANIAFCKKYAQNICSYDQPCLFRHCLTVEEYTALFKDPQPNIIATGGGLVPASGSAPPPDPLHTSSSPGNRPPPCSFFRKGTCKSGDKCRFYHAKDCTNIRSTGFCSDSSCTQCNQPDRMPGHPKRACQYWPTGTCRNGDDCPFAHEGQSGEVSGEVAEAGDDKKEEGVDAPSGGIDWSQGVDNSGWGPNNDPSAWAQNDNDNANDWGKTNNAADDWGNMNNAANDWGTTNNVDNDWAKPTRNTNNNGWASNNNSGWGTNDNHNWNRNQNDNGYRSRGQCYRFQQDGQCFRGSDCRFSHDVGGSSGGRGSRDHSRPRGRPVRPAAGSSRTHSDPKDIESWGRGVAESQAYGGSEAGSDRNNRSNDQSQSRKKQQREGGPYRGTSNRSVDLVGDGSCQFHLVGHCSDGDSCPLSHDPATTRSKPRDQEGGYDDVVRDGVDKDDDEEGLNYEEQEIDAQEDGEVDECTRETVEEIAPDDTNDQNHVFENTLVDQWENTPPEVPGEILRIDKPCLRYGQGHCRAGKDCRFLHIDPDQPNYEVDALEEEAQIALEEVVSEKETQTRLSDVDASDAAEVADYGHPLVEKAIFECAVIFGRDCLPESVTTATDSHILLLGAPSGITEARVHDVVNKYGAIEDITIMEEPEPADEEIEEEDQEAQDTPPPMAAVHVAFKDMKDAARAAKSLKLSLLDALPVEEAPRVSTWVKFRWPQPCRAAWVHYPTITKAKAMAEQLHGTIFQGRKISATFLRPEKRQKDLFAIKLEKLPASTTRVDLAEVITEASLINVSELTYTDKPQELLRQLEHVKNFVDVPEDPTKIYAMAFARFSSEEAIETATRMNEKKQAFLGKQELSVERVWFFHTTLEDVAFKAVESEVKALHVQCEGRAHVEISDHGEFVLIYVYAALEEAETFVKTNLSLQAICRGTIVTNNDRPEWDDYFYSTSSAKVLGNLNAKNQCYIFPDTQSRRIHVLGSGLDQDKGVSAIKKLLQRVRGSCQEHTIHRNAIQKLVNGGLSKIQGDVGVNKLSLDVLRSVLVVRGGDAALMQEIRHVLDYAPSSQNHGESSCSGPLCSVCELQPGGDDSNAVVKLSCSHVYCMACLQHALIFAAHNHSAPVKCIGRVPAEEDGSGSAACGQPIPYTTVRDLLPLVDEPKYLTSTFTSFVLSNPDEYFICPFLRCNGVYRRGEPEEIIRCPICRSWNCLHCGSFTHDGMSCEGAQQARKNVRT